MAFEKKGRPPAYQPLKPQYEDILTQRQPVMFLPAQPVGQQVFVMSTNNKNVPAQQVFWMPTQVALGGYKSIYLKIIPSLSHSHPANWCLCKEAPDLCPKQSSCPDCHPICCFDDLCSRNTYLYDPSPCNVNHGELFEPKFHT